MGMHTVYIDEELVLELEGLAARFGVLPETVLAIALRRYLSPLDRRAMPTLPPPPREHGPTTAA